MKFTGDTAEITELPIDTEFDCLSGLRVDIDLTDTNLKLDFNSTSRLADCDLLGCFSPTGGCKNFLVLYDDDGFDPVFFSMKIII